MKKILLLVLVVFMGVGQTQALNPFGKKTGMREIILVKFKKDVPPAQKEELQKLIKELKSAKTIEQVEWGNRVDYSGGTKDYDKCLMLEFKNDNNFEVFQANPMRVRLIGKLIAMSDKLLQFTYKIE